MLLLLLLLLGMLDLVLHFWETRLQVVLTKMKRRHPTMNDLTGRHKGSDSQV